MVHNSIIILRCSACNVTDARQIRETGRYDTYMHVPCMLDILQV